MPHHLLPALALLACFGARPPVAPADSGVDDSDAPDDSHAPDDSDPPEDTQPPPPADVDQDGYDETTDCDDLDPTVHPDAEEAWNEVDDDCDGRIDGDGDYEGIHAVTARAIYEGQAVDFAMDCPVTMSRTEGVLAFTAICTPDLGEPHADILLGEWVTIVLKESDAAVAGSAWSGRTVVTSANGWDSWGEASLVWSDTRHGSLTTSLDTFSLDMAGSGGLEMRPAQER